MKSFEASGGPGSWTFSWEKSYVVFFRPTAGSNIIYSVDDLQRAIRKNSPSSTVPCSVMKQALEERPGQGAEKAA